MAAVEITAEATPRGWFATLFGGQPRPVAARPIRRLSQRTFSAHPAVAQLAAELTEQRARDATSGFEMGEYEPHARRN
jgi:hypothetical protein